MLKQLGFKISEIIRLFVKQDVNAADSSFFPQSRFFNNETTLAIDELENNKGKKVKNSEKLFKDLKI